MKLECNGHTKSIGLYRGTTESRSLVGGVKMVLDEYRLALNNMNDNVSSGGAYVIFYE